MFSISILFNLIACGVPDATLLTDVTDEQAVLLCQEMGEVRTYTCEGDGFSYDLPFGYEDIEECDDEKAGDYPDGCDATVGEARACSDAYEAVLTDDPCSTETPDECDYFADCIG